MSRHARMAALARTRNASVVRAFMKEVTARHVSAYEARRQLNDRRTQRPITQGYKEDGFPPLIAKGQSRQRKKGGDFQALKQQQ